jgi:hypothetical protein
MTKSLSGILSALSGVHGSSADGTVSLWVTLPPIVISVIHVFRGHVRRDEPGPVSSPHLYNLSIEELYFFL